MTIEYCSSILLTWNYYSFLKGNITDIYQVITLIWQLCRDLNSFQSAHTTGHCCLWCGHVQMLEERFAEIFLIQKHVLLYGKSVLLLRVVASVLAITNRVLVASTASTLTAEMDNALIVATWDNSTGRELMDMDIDFAFSLVSTGHVTSQDCTISSIESFWDSNLPILRID